MAKEEKVKKRSHAAHLYLIPFLYILLISLFLYLHFTRTMEYKEQIGYIALKGEVKRINLKDNQNFSTLTATINGFTLNFSKDSGLWMYEKDIPFRGELLGYRTFPEGVEISLSRGLLLRILSAGGPNPKITVYPIFTDPQENITTLRIPVSLASQTTVKDIENLPITAFQFQAAENPATYFLSLPQGSRYDKTSRSIELTKKDGIWGEVVFEKAPEGISDPFVYWFEKEERGISENEFSEKVERYLQKAYSGWQSTRYRQNTGSWTVREGSPSFKETLSAAYLAEALKRGNYRNALTMIQQASARNTNQLSLFTAPYLGNLRSISESQTEKDLLRLRNITESLKRRDPKVFLEPMIVQFLLDRGPYSHLKELYSLGETIFKESQDSTIKIGLLSAYLEGLLLNPEVGKLFEFAEEIPQTEIFRNLYSVDKSLYFMIQNRIDLFESIKVGRLLMDFGRMKQEPFFTSLGRVMIVSALETSDDLGFMPRTITIQQGKISQRQGTLIPEEIYQFLTDQKYYPHQISLYSSLSPGAWIWTIADINYLRMERNEFRIGITFPEGEIHHMVIQGIKPFQSIQIYGIPWKSDPYFENYTAGWVYNRDTETLLVKLRHRAENEEMVIIFGQGSPEPEPEQPQPSQETGSRTESRSAPAATAAPAIQPPPRNPPPVQEKPSPEEEPAQPETPESSAEQSRETSQKQEETSILTIPVKNQNPLGNLIPFIPGSS